MGTIRFFSFSIFVKGFSSQPFRRGDLKYKTSNPAEEEAVRRL